MLGGNGARSGPAGGSVALPAVDRTTDERRTASQPRRGWGGDAAVPVHTGPACWKVIVPVPVRAGGNEQVPEAADPARRNEIDPVPCSAAAPNRACPRQ